MSAGDSRLGQKDTGGTLLAVGVGDVQPHAACSARADLDIYRCPCFLHRAVHHLHVPDQLRDVQGAQQFFGHIIEAVLGTFAAAPALLCDGIKHLPRDLKMFW